MKQIIGACGNCFGPVTIHEQLDRVFAACSSCGSVPEVTFGHVLKMNPPPKRPPNIGEEMVEAFIRARIEEGNA